MTDAKRRVLVLTPSKPGRRHDKNLVDRSQLVQSIPAAVGVIVDTGFQGVKHPNLFIPQKASKKRPLTPEDRASNRYISSQRIVVEHAIGGMKRYGAMHQVLRNKLGGGLAAQVDDAAAGAGAVVDDDDDGAVGAFELDAHLGADRQGGMGRGEFGLVVADAGGGHFALPARAAVP